MVEELSVHNHAFVPLSFELSVLFDADFADIFQVKARRARRGTTVRRHREGERITLSYQRDHFRRETYIQAPDAYFTEQSLTFRGAGRPPQAWWTQTVSVDGRARPATSRCRSACTGRTCRRAWTSGSRRRPQWTPTGTSCARSTGAAWSTWPRCGSTPSRARRVAAGRRAALVHGAVRPGQPHHQLPGDPVRARAGPHHAAGARRRTRPPSWDDFRDAEPGKILHELRHGELAALPRAAALAVLRLGRRDAAVPHRARRVRAVDRRRGDRPAAGAGRPGPRWSGWSGTATSTATATSSTGPATRRPAWSNQCWKDSWNSIVHPDGRLASLPRAMLRDPGVRLRRAAAHGPAGARGLGRPGAGRPAGARRGGAAGRVRPRLLAARRRASTRSRWTGTSSRCRR